MGRRNFAVVIKRIQSKIGEGWKVQEIVDIRKGTCCGLQFPWLRSHAAWGYGHPYDCSNRFYRPANPWYASDKYEHQIYWVHRWNGTTYIKQYVFFTKYPENYFKEGDGCSYSNGNPTQSSLEKGIGERYITIEYDQKKISTIVQQIETQAELEARIDELSSLVVAHNLRISELKAELGKLPKHNFID